jgi:hypothetical protein
MAPTLILVLALICRIESLASSRKRSTSLIFRIEILFAGMTPILEKRNQSSKRLNKQCVKKDSCLT